jgi:hypothetical protein
MKQTKPYLLVLVSVFLIISIGLLSATAYLYFYNGNSNFAGIVSEPDNNINTKKNAAISRDSLEKIYTSAIVNYDSSGYNVMPANFVDTAVALNTNARDSYLDSLNNKTQQHQTFDKLRTEIDQILLDKSPSADLNLAKSKINELKQLNEGLKNKNNTIIKENDRLFNMVKQMSVSNSPTTTKTINTGTDKTVVSKNATISFNTNASTLKVDDIQLSAYKTNSFIDKETNNTQEADKMVGTVQIKNNGVKTAIAEVMVVVTQPNGKVLQNSNWESGVFNTTAGKKIYSNKLRFDNNFETTSKKISFALQTDTYMAGNYTVELYQNGVLIAKTIKTFN